MAIDTEKYSNELRKLCEDYYFHDISQTEYVQRRNDIFKRIERDITTGARIGIDVGSELYDMESLTEDFPYNQE